MTEKWKEEGWAQDFWYSGKVSRRRFVGWGGGAIGALTVSFIQTGVVGAGLSGFYVQFFYGLIIILSLLGHRWNQARYR
jgi:hypothetical protein